MDTSNLTNAQLYYGNLVSLTNSTLPPLNERQTTVELYIVILSAMLLATACLCGFFINISLLVSILWKRHILCSLKYALPINLLVSNLLFCLFWAPVEIVRILIFYNQGYHSSLHFILFYYTWHLFAHCIILLFVTVVFIVIYQICLQIVDNKNSLDYITISGLIVSWLGGILVVVVHSLRITDEEIYSYTYPYMIAVFLLIIAGAMVLLGAVIVWRKNLLAALTAENERLVHRDSNACSTSDPQSVSKSDQEEKESGSSQLCLTTGKSKTAAPEAITPTRGITFAKGSKQKISQDNVSEVSEDEDSFDMKMRMKFRALASRRHTIGNVGEDPFGQTSSFGPRPGAAKAKNYQYVRKWSVDVTALQDQLENPKRHGGSLPFQELAILPEREPLVPLKSALKKKTTTEAIMEENTNHKNFSKENDDQCTELCDTETKAPEENQKKTSKATTFSNTVTEKDDNNTITKHDSIEIESTTKPNIVVNGTNAENPRSCEQLTDEEINRQNSNTLSRHIRATKYVFCLVITYTFSLLPFFIYVLYLYQKGSDLHSKPNIMICVTCIAPLQAIVHPFILYHMEQKIKQTYRKLRLRVTHWRFVCYCNTCTLKRQKGGSIAEDPDEDKPMTKV